MKCSIRKFLPSLRGIHLEYFSGGLKSDKNRWVYSSWRELFWKYPTTNHINIEICWQSRVPTFFDWVSQDIPSSKMLENGCWTFKKPLQSKNSSFKKCRSECLISPEFIPEPKYRSAPLRDSQPCVLRIFRRAQVADSENPWNTLPC